MPPKKTLKDCPPGQYRHPDTNRCRKNDATRKYIPPTTTTTNDTNITTTTTNIGKTCKQPCEVSGKICNPKTGRCINPPTIRFKPPSPILGQKNDTDILIQPNSIVLFFACHGAERGNLLDDTSKLLKRKPANVLADLQENVKITLSSAASVSSHGTQIYNKIEEVKKKLTFRELAKNYLTMSLVWSTSDNTILLLRDSFGYNYVTDVKEKVASDSELCMSLSDKNYKKIEDIFLLTKQIDFKHPEVAKQFLASIIPLPELSYYYDNKLNKDFYGDLFIYLSFFHKIMIEQKKIVFEDNNDKYDDLDLYNNDEMAAINEMIQFYCIDNPNHRITDSMYYHCRLVVKDIFDKSIGKMYDEPYIKYLKEYFANKPANENDLNDRLLFADKNNEKIVDVTMDEHSLDRWVQFKPNSNEVKNRTYGCHIIKAFHNGTSFCSAVNDYTTEQFVEADRDYNRGKVIEGYNYDNNEQYLLSDRNPFIQDIIKTMTKAQEKTINTLLFKMVRGQSYLSHVIALCKLLGFVKIYITDTSCRPNWDQKSLNIAMRPSEATKKGYQILPDNPILGDTVHFALPDLVNGREKWSQQPGKIIDMVKGNDGNYTYTINTSATFSGVKVVEPVNKVISSAQKRPIQFEQLSNNTSWHASAEDYEQYRNNDNDNDNFVAVVGDSVNFIIPETGTWSSRPGNILRVFTNSTGVSYDIEVPGDTFDNVLKVEDFIKMRTWTGGKGNKKNNEKKNASRKKRCPILGKQRISVTRKHS